MYQPVDDEVNLLNEYMSFLESPGATPEKLKQLWRKPYIINGIRIRISQGPLGSSRSPHFQDERMFIFVNNYIIKRKLITSLDLFLYGYNISFNSLEEFLFTPKSLINRIILAIVCDNSAALDLFLQTYESVFPGQSINDFIIANKFIGFAAANGCINVMKYFINRGINLEQKFDIQLDPAILFLNSQPYSQKSILYQYQSGGCTLQMTPLALALSAAPAMPREEAKAMIELLLDANANYNIKIIKKWDEMRGYYNNQHKILRSEHITLFEFDKIGILDEVVKKKQEKKSLKISNHGSGPTKPNYKTDSAEIYSLKAELAEVKRENAALKEEIIKLRQAIGESSQVVPQNPGGTECYDSQNRVTQSFFKKP